MTAGRDTASPEVVARLRRAVEQEIEIRRQAFRLAGRACVHMPSLDRICRVCGDAWPCAKVRQTAQPLLDAIGGADDLAADRVESQPAPIPRLLGDPLAPSVCSVSWAAT